MRAVDFIKMSLESSKERALDLIEDMRDAPLTQPTPNGGNHPLWVLGHLVHSESGLFDGFVLGKPNRFPELADKFGMGSEPTTNPDDYPSLGELKEKFELVRASVLQHLETLNDDDLDQKSHAPEDYAAYFGTVGAVYSILSLHVSFHSGQVADARRAAGKSVLRA